MVYRKQAEKILSNIEIPGKYHSGEATSPTFDHANANFSVFVDRISNQFLKK